MATNGNIGEKSFQYWKQMATIGNMESGGAGQVNKVLAQFKVASLVHDYISWCIERWASRQRINYRGGLEREHRGKKILA